MTKMKKINCSFSCENCGHLNPRHPTSCRNHCKNCLFSKHVDFETPGDRQSDCLSLMKPLSAKSDKKRGMLIYHQCLKCQKVIANKAAPDDDQELVIHLSTIPYEPSGA